MYTQKSQCEFCLVFLHLHLMGTEGYRKVYKRDKMRVFQIFLVITFAKKTPLFGLQTAVLIAVNELNLKGDNRHAIHPVCAGNLE